MKLKYLLPILAIATLTVSCKDYLNLSDPDSISENEYYKNESDIQASVYGVYAQLGNSDIYGSRAPHYQECKARLLIYPNTGVNAGENASFDNCSVMATNQFVLNRWNALYNCIDRVNVVLDHLGDVSYAAGTGRNYYEGEMRFVRALCYYLLVTDWGDVPLVLKKLKSLDEIRAANVRKPKAEVYQAIYDDCKWVIESSNLPEIQSKAGCGRTGKVAARALYAKALLQQATDGDFASQKKTLSDQAVTLLKDALSKAPFTDFTTVDVSEIWNVASQTSAQERIFQLNYVGGSASANSSYNTMFRPEKINDAENGEVNATKAAGSFFMGYQKTLDLYDEEGDLRMERLIALGTESSLPIYYTLKYKDLDKSGYYGCDCIVFRFADVVAMLAEANYHAGNNGEAVKYINMIRKRAGLSDTSASSGTALRDVIYKERQREFAYEFKAWNDMKRGYTKQEIFDIMKADGAAMYGDEDYLLPIPSVQQKLNPEGLPQNPGY